MVGAMDFELLAWLVHASYPEWMYWERACMISFSSLWPTAKRTGL